MAGKKSADAVVVESVGDVAADEKMAGFDQAEGGAGGPIVPTEGLVLGNNMWSWGYGWMRCTMENCPSSYQGHGCMVNY